MQVARSHARSENLFLGRRGSADDTTRKSTLCGDRRGRGAKTHGFFAICKVPARPSAGIGVVEVQKLEVFCDV